MNLKKISLIIGLIVLSTMVYGKGKVKNIKSKSVNTVNKTNNKKISKIKDGIYIQGRRTDWYEIKKNGDTLKLKFGIVDPRAYIKAYNAGKIIHSYGKEKAIYTDLPVLQSKEWITMVPLEIKNKTYFKIAEINEYFYADEDGNLEVWIFENGKPVDKLAGLEIFDKNDRYAKIPKPIVMSLKEILKIKKSN